MPGRVPASAPSGSAPVGTAGTGAARTGTQPRRREQLRDREVSSPVVEEKRPSTGGESPSAPRSWRLPRPPAGGVVADASGALLAVVVWSWLVLPFLQGGRDRVRDMLRAKFLNKGSDGSWLP